MAPASIAAWKAAGAKRPPEPRPHQVVPSGKTTTREPPRSAEPMVRTVVGSARSRSRSTKSVPPRAASGPSSGQPRISLLASIRPGNTAATSGMSSQEMWFATTSVPAAPGAVPGPAGVPVIRTRTPKARTTPYAQHRISRSRRAAPSTAMNGAPSAPAVIHRHPASSRAVAAGRPRTRPS